MVHCPLIDTKPLPIPQAILNDFNRFTHVILTSPNAVKILQSQFSLKDKQVLAIGTGTAELLQYKPLAIASTETQEGMIELLKQLSLEHAYILYPRSSQARPLLGEYLKTHYRCQICDLYETINLKPDPLPNLDDFDEIVFTSPSTVRAFMALYGKMPENKKLTCIGPITERVLLEIEP